MLEYYLAQLYLLIGWQPMTWFNIYMLATLGDAATTLYALKKGAYEANPIMRKAMQIFTPPVALFVLKALAATSMYALLLVAPMYIMIPAVIFVAISVWNLFQIRKSL